MKAEGVVLSTLISTDLWTFSRIMSHGPTYKGHFGRHSRIDYILTRLTSADLSSKQVGQLVDAPFLPEGSTHIPLLAHLSYQSHRPSRAMNGTFSKSLKMKCINESREDTLVWQRCQNDINMALRHHEALDTLDDIRDLVGAQLTLVYCKEGHRISSPGVGLVQAKWHHYKLARDLAGHHLADIFRKWHHIAAFRQLERRHRKYVKSWKVSQIRQLVEDAESAFQRHDPYLLYKAVRQRCPRMIHKRIHLKDKDGNFLCPTKETSMYCQYISEQWSGPPLQFEADEAPGIPFTYEQLLHALECIPVTKSVAAPFAPGAVWKAQAPFLTEWLWQKLQVWWSCNPPHIPQEWKDGWLCMLPKPGKSTTCITNLRPLALQEPVGKAVIKLITRLALKQCMPDLCYLPQYAYMPRRSTRDAILRLVRHCTEVRTMLIPTKKSIHIQTQHQHRPLCCGGIQLFIDLRRAFDQIPRPVLLEALRRVTLEPALLTLLISWHQQTNYHFQANGDSRCIEIQRGVRQGCCAAPFLWICSVALLLDRLSQRLSLTWLQKHLTIYADDCHLVVAFHNEASLLEGIKNFGIVVDAIHDLGLELSPSKSCILFTGCGTRYQHWRSKLVRPSNQGSRVFHLETARGTLPIPIQTKSIYLGVMISYNNFELQTMHLRVKAGVAQFKRLQKWLCGRGSISLSLKLRIFQQCVMSCINYGLPFVGVTPPGLKIYRQQTMLLYRKLVGDMPHVTHHSHEYFFANYPIQRPEELLKQLVVQAKEGLLLALRHVSAQDIIHSNDWTPLELTRTTIETTDLTTFVNVSTGQEPDPVLSCSKCNFQTHSPQALQRHLTMEHKQFRRVTRRVDIATASQDGFAVCAKCNQSFSSWGNFRTHVMNDICGHRVAPLPREAIPESAARAFDLNPLEDLEVHVDMAVHQDFVDRATALAKEAAFETLKADQLLCQHLTQHCVLCSKFMISAKAYTMHMRAHHQSYMQDSIALGLQRAQQFNGTKSPCDFCGVSFIKRHVCVPCTQMAVLEIQNRTVDADHPLVCYLCDFNTMSRAELRKHLQDKHQFRTYDFKPARDSEDDQVTCAHCHYSFANHECLRKHIQHGHCSQFNPDKAWTRSGDEDIAAMVRAGQFDTLFADVEIKQRLTKKCQFCTVEYKEARFMVQHLYAYHMELVDRGTLLSGLLKTMFGYTRGCACIPAVKLMTTKHMCIPFMQLGMLHYQLGDWLTVPLIFSDHIREPMDAHLPHEQVLLLHDSLIDRNFKRLAEDDTFIEIFRTKCMCCGHQVNSTEMLGQHLRARHAEPYQAIDCFVDMIVYYHSNDGDATCRWCQLNLQTPQIDYEDHLAECSVLRHFATFLAQPLKQHGSRGTKPNAGGVRAHAEKLQPRANKRQEASKDQQPIGDFFKRQQRRRLQSSTTGGADGSSHSETRAGCAGNPEPMQLHPLSGDFTGLNSAIADEEIHGLERGQTTGDSRISTTCGASAVHSPNDVGQGSEDSNLQQKGSIVDCLVEKQLDPGRRLLAIPGLEPTDQSSGGTAKEKGYSDGRSADRTSRAHQHDLQGQGHRSIPLSEESTRSRTSLPMEAGCGFETSLATSELQHSSWKQCVAAGGDKDEGAQSKSEQIGGPSGSANETLAEIKEVTIVNIAQFGGCLQKLILVNNDTQCYLNAAFLTVCWCHLQCQGFSSDQWPWIGAHLFRMLVHDSATPLELGIHQAMQPALQQWGTIRGSGQQDLSEFLTFFLGWLHTTRVCLATERRVETDHGVEVVDKSGAYSPILLCSELWENMEEPFPFQTVLQAWMELNGMHQALIKDSPLLCFQVCRFTDHGQADNRAFAFGIDQYSIDLFMDEHTSKTTAVYTLAALIAYTGDSVRGHYMCAVRVLHVGVLKWLICDDNQRPLLHQTLPHWIACRTSHVWLIKKADFIPWTYDMYGEESGDTPTDAMSAVLAMLTTSQT